MRPRGSRDRRIWLALGAAGWCLVAMLAAMSGRVDNVEAAVAPPVSVAYADTHHPPSKGLFPSPWFGSPNVVFVGTTTNDWDSGAIKIDNTTGVSMSGVHVTVDIGTAHYNLWGASLTIPANQSLILTQMNDVFLDFDTSDNDPNPPGFPTAVCSPPSAAVPVVHVTIGQTTFDYVDAGKVLNTGGVDSAHCGVGGDESHLWTPVGPAGAAPTPTPTAPPPPAATSTPTPSPLPATSSELAVGFAEASQQPGLWSVPAPFQLSVNWGGSPGSRPLAVAVAAASTTGTVTGPTITNASAQAASGGSLLLVRGPSVVVRGAGTATNVSGVNGGSSATLASPTGMQAGDLVVVYINTPNTMTVPAGWTLQHHDGQGTVWSQVFPAVPTNLGTWTTTGSSGWTYVSVDFGGSGGSPGVVATGGGGAQTRAAVVTGSATNP
jgi:hypothetical protein